MKFDLKHNYIIKLIFKNFWKLYSYKRNNKLRIKERGSQYLNLFKKKYQKNKSMRKKFSLNENK